MKIYQLERTQTLPMTIEQAWSYFSNPTNLTEITPPELSLCIKGNYEGEIYNGMMIEYTVKPLLGVPMDWVSEIKHVHAPYLFVDEQRVGPYKIWYHQHFFKKVGSHVEVKDRVYYALPFGLLAPVLNQWVIKKQLEIIFEYRRRVLEKKFRNSGQYEKIV